MFVILTGVYQLVSFNDKPENVIWCILNEEYSEKLVFQSYLQYKYLYIAVVSTSVYFRRALKLRRSKNI